MVCALMIMIWTVSITFEPSNDLKMIIKFISCHITNYPPSLYHYPE